ncbi:hypothetical protein HCN44_000116 [Aphidius gifuensis]|uniref:Spaetzle domain-containing protein n=2 Tax=Aphidius gifuensis TaxID=684658 RepID=A0A834XP38_APHGI|nr:hypothetical protein HCN44_000116 [Aphidius gifuensis]
MSLGNFSLPFQLATPSPYLYTPNDPLRLRLNAVVPSSVNFQDERRYQNEPYIPPAAYQQQKNNQQSNQQKYYKQNYQSQNQQQHNYDTRNVDKQNNQYVEYQQNYQTTQTKSSDISLLQQEILQPPPLPSSSSSSIENTNYQENQNSRIIQNQQLPLNENENSYPERPEGFTRVNGGSFGNSNAKTSVHAVLDYDDDGDDNVDDYYDENIPHDARVTPIQGPIYLKNGSVPVVPLYSYPQLQNGSFVQIPILWTALSVALGAELRGDLVRGTPCIKKNHQLFCPTAGNKYPTDRIEQFIDENKALMKRMYGDFEMNGEYGPETSSSPRRRKKRSDDLPDGGPNFKDQSQSRPRVIQGGDSYFDKIRNPRQSFTNNRSSDSGRIDACESKIEIVTPYWASNSAGKIRAIVNTQHFEQAIHQEVCSKTQTNRCIGDCGCEQKYKWHRLLAYDPDNDCKGIFMDWFLFPSCCVCRCDPRGKFPGTTTSTNTNQRG